MAFEQTRELACVFGNEDSDVSAIVFAVTNQQRELVQSVTLHARPLVCSSSRGARAAAVAAVREPASGAA